MDQLGLSEKEQIGMAIRVLGLAIIALWSIRLFRYRMRWVYFFNCAVAMYHSIVYLAFLFDFGWNIRLLVALGWPSLLVCWIGLLIELTRKQAREL